MRMSKRARILAVASLTVAALIIFALTSSFGKKEEVIHRIPVNLNETLTNEMSDTSVLDGFDKKVKDYMTYWGLRGASLSVMRNDSLLFSKGYGWADEKEPMTPGHILRMASVSKLITAVGIMVLEEKGLLRLDDQVFGPGGILDDSLYNAAIADSLYMKITVEDLLRHKGGFSKKGGDPMFSTRWIMSQNAWKEVPTKEQLTVLQLKRALAFEPGTFQEYSNYGYLALSMVIEKVSGMEYEDFIQEKVFHPIGCVNFKLAGNYYADKHPGEVRYYVQKDDQPVDEFNNSGRKVTRSYGGNDVSGLLGAGAWVGSTPELVYRRQAGGAGFNYQRERGCDDGVLRPGHIFLGMERHQAYRGMDPHRFFRRHHSPREILPRRRVLGIHRQHQHLQRPWPGQVHHRTLRRPAEQLFEKISPQKHVLRGRVDPSLRSG